MFCSQFKSVMLMVKFKTPSSRFLVEALWLDMKQPIKKLTSVSLIGWFWAQCNTLPNRAGEICQDIICQVQERELVSSWLLVHKAGVHESASEKLSRNHFTCKLIIKLIVNNIMHANPFIEHKTNFCLLKVNLYSKYNFCICKIPHCSLGIVAQV